MAFTCSMVSATLCTGTTKSSVMVTSDRIRSDSWQLRRRLHRRSSASSTSRAPASSQSSLNFSSPVSSWFSSKVSTVTYTKLAMSRWGTSISQKAVLLRTKLLSINSMLVGFRPALITVGTRRAAFSTVSNIASTSNRYGGRGCNFRVTSVMMPRVPSDPMISCSSA